MTILMFRALTPHPAASPAPSPARGEGKCRLRLPLALAAWFVLAAATPAHADPISTAIVSFLGLAGTALGAIAGVAINAAIGLGLSFVAQAIRGKSRSSTPTVGGASGKLQAGGAIRRSFLLGRGMAEPTLVYDSYFGEAGGTPNAYLVQVIALADLPGHTLEEVWLYGEKLTWNPLATPSTEGIAIPEYTVEGVEHLWLRYYDGTQIAADARLVALFSDHANWPYGATRVGHGMPYVVVTARVNPKLFTGFPTPSFVLGGIPLYDRRFDSTAGGLGIQRLADPATWSPSGNPIVHIENIVRGIRYNGAWVYGGQTTGEGQLPAASFFAAGNACDTVVLRAGGAIEPQFSAGGAIGFDVEPADAIEEELKSCNGRMAESGGVYRVRVGSAGVAVFSLTDGDIRSDDAQSYAPFPGLARVINGARAKYVCPAEGWRPDKDVALTYSAYEAEDGGRRQLADLTFGLVASDGQVQQLMAAFVARERAWRQHVLPLPFEAAVLEPLDLVSWSSARNGYTDKLFDTLYVDDLPGVSIVAGLKEVDPAADDWSAEDEIPVSVAPIGQQRPPPQAMTGWSAEPYTPDGYTPGIRVTYPGRLDDVRSVRIQVRLQAGAVLKFDGEVPYETEVDEPSAVPQASFVRKTAYAARGILLPYSNRATQWSEWFAVTTPDVGLSEDQFDARLNAKIKLLDAPVQESLAAIRDRLQAQIEELAAQNAGAWALQIKEANSIIQSVGQRMGMSEASILEVRQAVATVDSALALYFLGLQATTESGEASVDFQIAAQSVSGDQLARVAFLLRAGAGGNFATGGMEMVAYYNAALSAYRTRTTFYADDLYLQDADGNRRRISKAVIGDDAITIPIISGAATPDLKAGIPAFRITANQNFTLYFPANAWLGARFILAVKQDATGGRTMSYDNTAISLPAPAIDGAPNITTILDCTVRQMLPVPIMNVQEFGEPGQVSSESVTIFAISPAYAGKTIWNLAIDGELSIPGPWSGTITPLGTGGLQCLGDFHGPGGSTGGVGASVAQPGAGTNTSFAGLIIAAAGGVSASLQISGPILADTPVAASSPGAGGTASGGTNTTGANGGVAEIYPSSQARGGSGGNTPDCGGATPAAGSATRGHAEHGVAGGAIGGGAAGGFTIGTDATVPPNMRAIGGGAHGGKTIRAFTAGQLVYGVPYALVVGDAGAAGIGSGNVNYGTGGVNVMQAINGAKGGPGRVRFYI